MRILHIKISFDGWDYVEVRATERVLGSDDPGQRLIRATALRSEEGHLLLERLSQELLASIQTADELAVDRRFAPSTRAVADWVESSTGEPA
jgi:hypothetical protein